MSLYDYETARSIRGAGFDALIMAAALTADTTNLAALTEAFPRQVAEARNRYNAPGGRLPTDPGGAR